MAFFRSENNVFCDTVKVEVKAGETAEGIRPSKNFKAQQQPYKLDSVSLSFKDAASSTVSIYAVKSGVELLVRAQELDSASSVIVSNIGLWLTSGDSVKVENDTSQDAMAIVDFSY